MKRRIHPPFTDDYCSRALHQKTGLTTVLTTTYANAGKHQRTNDSSDWPFKRVYERGRTTTNLCFRIVALEKVAGSSSLGNCLTLTGTLIWAKHGVTERYAADTLPVSKRLFG